MEEFSLQLKLLKYSGFARNSSDRMKVVFKILIYFHYFITFHFWFSTIAFVYKSNDILNISESLAPTFTGIFTIVKYIVFHRQFKEFYDAMDKIGYLNKKCR